MRVPSAWGLFFALVIACSSVGQPFGQVGVPDNYYDTATGSGAVLQGQLYEIIRSGHRQASYSNFQNNARKYDNTDPGFGRDSIFLAYDRQVVDPQWDSGQTWNREHVWPVSRQPGSVSEGVRGMLADPFVLRPTDPGVNQLRDNLPFGGGESSLGYGVEGPYFFPGHDDKGDVARALFYAETRYGPETGVALVNGLPSGNEMGDLASLIRWHYEDGVDAFEHTRNDRIFFDTRNRNPFIDNPGYVWSVYVDQENDSRITLEGADTAADGGSRTVINYGRFLPGIDASVSEVFHINKTGEDGTHFAVNTDTGINARVIDNNQAFEIGEEGSVRLVAQVFSLPSAAPGRAGGVITIDNLDVTDGFGIGHGAQDADDVIELIIDRVGHARPSLNTFFVREELTLDFGDVDQFSRVDPLDFGLYNDDAFGFLEDFVAALDLDEVIGNGDTGVLTTDLELFSGLELGDEALFKAMIDTSVAGQFEATYTLVTSDEDLPGDQRTTNLSLQLLANVLPSEVIPEPAIALVLGVSAPIFVRRRRGW